MRSYKLLLSGLLSKSLVDQEAKDFVENLNSQELAHAFVDVAFLASALKFVEEERWTQNKVQDQKSLQEIPFAKFIKKLFKVELAPVLFLHSFLESSSLEGVGRAFKNSGLIEKAVVQKIKTKPYPEQKIFATTTLQLMSELFEFEHQLNLQKKEDGIDISLSLYRTFDILDQVFELNYLTNEEASVGQKERLYEGAGVGVQSSYATTLIALRYLNPAKGSKFIDLGSGYGRVGLVIGLLRPDIDFNGYEFVSGRVDIANAATTNLGINQHVKFHTQDLSLIDFKIPVADAYYIFDSFSDDSYKHVLLQLLEISKQKKITVVTKGNARLQLQNESQRGNWSQPQEFNGGNLCLFRSR